MNKHRGKSAKADPTIEAATKVIATVVKPIDMVKTPDSPTIASAEYEAAVDNVKAALAAYGRSAWQLAWALVAFKAAHQKAHPTERLTDKQLGDVLSLKLTHQRIGQLMNTAKAFPRDQVDESIDFEVYNRARTTLKLLTPEQRLALVKQNPTTAAINKLKPGERRRNAAARCELTIRVLPAGTDAAQPEITVRLNGETHALPVDLVAAIRAYAVEVFGKSDGAAEAAAQ